MVILNIAEPESDALKSRLLEAEAVADCRIAWATAHAAFARRGREVPEDNAIIDKAKTSLAA